jgi:hypothetical protein
MWVYYEGKKSRSARAFDRDEQHIEEGGVSKETSHAHDGALHGDSTRLDSVALEIHQNAVSGSSFLTLRRPLSTNSTYRGRLLIAMLSHVEKMELVAGNPLGSEMGLCPVESNDRMSHFHLDSTASRDVGFCPSPPLSVLIRPSTKTLS